MGGNGNPGNRGMQGNQVQDCVVKRPLLFCGHKDSVTPIREEPQ